MSLLALLSQLGITPDVVAGHSFGEVTALHCAGVFDRKVFLAVARKRGELMAEAATLYPGAMAAIFHNAEAVASMLADWKTGVVIANHNSPDQVVISGSESAIQATEERLRQAAIRFQRLPVSTAFHSAIVSPAAAPFRSFLDEVSVGKPLIPVYANSMAAAYSNMPDAIRETLAGQIAEPVRFAEQIETMYAAGVRTFVEVGPGAVLTNLVKSCLKDRPYQAVALDRKGQHGLTSLWQGLAQLAVAAVPLALEQLWEGVAYGDDPRRRSTPKLAVNISGANYAKPYPPAGGAAGLAAPNPPRNGTHPAVNNQHATADEMNSANNQSTNNTPAAADGSPEPHETQHVAPSLASITLPAPQQPAPYTVLSAPAAQPKAAQAPVQPESLQPAPVHPAPAVVASNPVIPATNAGESLAWVNALQTLQQQTADAHIAFLQVAEQSMRSLEAMLSLAAATHGVSPGPAPIAASTAEQPSATANGNSLTAYSAPIPGRAVEEYPAPAPSEAPVAPPVMAFSPDHANVVAAQRTPETTDNGASRPLHDNQLATDDTPSAPPAHDLHAVLMTVVTEKTGYPSEMLEPGMALDTDLGIDSIKRVEILAAMRERVPALPEFDTGVMAGLRTLGEIVAYMDEQLGQASSTHEYEVSSVQDQQPTPDSSLSDPIRRYVLEMSPKPAPGLAPPYLVDGTAVYITDDGSGIAARLAEHLAQAGARTTVCTNVPADARAVICLAGLGAVSDVEAALTANEDAFQIATTIAGGFEAEGGLFVTVQDTGGDLGLHAINGERAWLGGLSGLAKTAAQEWPKAVVRTIDLATAQLSPAAAAERLAAELLNGADDREIGLTADGERYAFVSTEKEAAGGADTVTANSVIVVSGGGRGVTAEAAIELAKTARPHIALLGRSVLEEEPADLQMIGDDAGLKKALLAVAQAKGQRLTPRELGAATDRILAAREIRATLQALQSAGSEAIYLSCDITDSAATETALEQIRAKWGPITGIIHGAGVLADKRLAKKSGDDFRRVFGAKIRGLRSLLAATANDPLSVICLFSSVVARTGNAGQSDYAMANEVLNRVANDLAKQRKGCVVKSIGWGPWAGGMVTPILRAKFDEMGVPLIPLASGARHFVAELQQATAAEVEVIIGSVPQQAPLIDLHQEHSAQPAIYDVVVSAATTPYLLSHQIEGVVVVPLVIVQEWFLRAANTFGDGLAYNALRKVRVLRGIPLPAFADRPTSLRIRIEPDPIDTATLNATLFDDVGVARFAAQIVQSLESQPAPMSGETLAAASIAGAEYYRSQLFHGPAFATLQTVDQLSENGAQADLAVSRNVGWPHDFWRSDPALIDGGLQLALVWGFATLNQLTLPTAIDAFVLHEPGLLAADRRVRCIVEGKPIGQSGARFDLWFVDALNGANIAEIRGLETYVSSPPPLIGDAE
ncbi:MAG: SDR family NAD(P)-dependent oxidoreductase [Halieaceae bacterium]|nr:SDR family NAD(P)-dependent oxidoreductase [Halieaceae bacterium]